MPKISRHSGATTAPVEIEVAGGVVEVDPSATGEQVEQLREALAPAGDGEGEQSSPGSSSETSPSKQPQSGTPSEDVRPKPARKTGSRSPKGRAASSTARTTGGGGRETPAEGDAEKE